MTRPSPRDRDEFWLPVASLARLFAMTPQGFRSSILPLVAPTDRRQAPGGLEVFGRAALDAWAGREWERQSRQIVGDGVLSGPNSPALEEARRYKAGLLRIDLAERQNEIVSVSEVYDFHTQICAVVRGAGERLAREVGEPARRILDAALDDLERLTTHARIGRTPEVRMERQVLDEDPE